MVKLPVSRRKVAVWRSLGVEFDAPVRELEAVLRLIPPPKHGAQSVVQARLSVWPEPDAQETAFDRFGNQVVTCRFAEVSRAVWWRVEFEVEASAGPTLFTASEAAEIFRQSTPLTECTEDLPRSATADVFAIANLIHSRMLYDETATGEEAAASNSWRIGRGVCRDYAHIMLALCRSAGIPARYVAGVCESEGNSAVHAWVEVAQQIKGRGNGLAWLPFDPTRNRVCDETYVVVATGRDYQDAKTFSGSFWGTAHATLRQETKVESRCR